MTFMIPSSRNCLTTDEPAFMLLKAVVLGSNLKVLVHAEVKFDIDLPEFRTCGGVNAGSKNNEFYVRPVMWVKALDMVLDRLVVQGADLTKVAAVSGSAQQHGSLYWSKRGVETLKNLDADKFLHAQINDSAFTVNKTPVWMDGTTEKQCAEMEELVGGRDEMVKITGSKAYSRFTGSQIRKIYQQQQDCYEETARISLVSSFLASLFLGNVAPIDYADGSGMNLFDIGAKTWSKVCLDACAPDLEEKLGVPSETCQLIGKISPFFVQRYGFDSNCKISAFTGDNPSALTGMLVGEDWLAISLGTSDTIMMGLDKPTYLEEGHVLCHPANQGYMGLLCFRNGSLVRDVFKRADSNNSWDHFSELLDSAPRGNNGNMALHFHSKEIIPSVKGTIRWMKNNSMDTKDKSKGVVKFSSPQIEIRALIEGQMIHRRVVAAEMGFSFGENTKILATGGASANKSILQVMSDVFNAPVYTQKAAEAALLGSAYRAKYSLYLANLPAKQTNHEEYAEFITKFVPNHFQRVCEPCQDSKEIYPPMMKRYREMVRVLENQKE